MKKDNVIRALFLFAEHHEHYTGQCLDLIHHVGCGGMDISMRNAKNFIMKHINESPWLTDDVRQEIIGLLEKAD